MLKYLFTAEYKDGHIVKQSAEDISAHDPKRSCFYDLIRLEALQEELKTLEAKKLSDENAVEENGVLPEKLFTSEDAERLALLPSLITQAENEPNQKDIVGFVLRGEGHTYGVDLRDGHFEVDGVPFFMHEDSTLFGFKMVFFRQHTHSFEVGVKSGDVKKEISHQIVYRFGWQCTVGGKNHQRIMQIS